MTQTDICNMALTRIGVSLQLVNVQTDGTREALSALALWTDARDFVVQDYHWQRARAYATPNLATNFANPANTDWTYAYRYPSDALFIRRILTANGRLEINPPAFAIGRDAAFGTAAAWSSLTTYVIGNIVLQASVVYECISGNTNQQPPNATYWRVVSNAQLIFTDTASATFEYTAQVTDTTQWSPEFISMVAWRLGAGLSLALSRTQDMAKTCLEMYAAEKKQAEDRAALEGQKDTPVDSTDATTQEIVNFALLRLGITRDTAPKAAAQLLSESRFAKIAYLRERDFVLRDFPWPWAKAYADPVLFAGDQNAPFNKDWIFAYKFPADCFYVRRVVNPLERADYRRKRMYQFGGDEMWPPPFATMNGAFGTVQIASSNVLANDTITINGQTYTFKTALTGATGNANEVLIGPDSGTTALHLAEAINGGPNAGTDFGLPTVANAGVVATVDGTITNPPASPIIVGSFVTVSGLNGTSVNWSTNDTTNIILNPTSSLLTGRLILCNEPSPITIEYTRKLTSPAEFDSYDVAFSSMLAWRLAADLAPSRLNPANDPKLIQVVEKKAASALAMYQLEKLQAQRSALNEQQQQEPLEAEWIRGR